VTHADLVSKKLFTAATSTPGRIPQLLGQNTSVEHQDIVDFYIKESSQHPVFLKPPMLLLSVGLAVN